MGVGRRRVPVTAVSAGVAAALALAPVPGQGQEGGAMAEISPLVPLAPTDDLPALAEPGTSEEAEVGAGDGAAALLGRVDVPVDTVEAVEADPVIVTAERARLPLAVSTSAVSHLDGADVDRYPQATAADALRQVPGVAMVDFHGQGFEPELMVRGFYGGGEAEYVVVLLDGMPLNDVTGGLVRWDEIPSDAVERVEVLRGGASALWGDAAVGAVVNVVTRPEGELASSRWSVAGGEHGTVRASGGAGIPLGDREVEVFGGLDRTDGFRAGSDREVVRGGARYDFLSATDDERTLALSALSHRRDAAEPGPLTEDELASDRAQSSPFHRFDGTEEWTHRLGLEGRLPLEGLGRLSGTVAAERRSAEVARTLRMGTDFADTEERHLVTGRGHANLQLEVDAGLLADRDRLVLGGEVTRSSTDSEHYELAMGPPEAYEAATRSADDPRAAGRGARTAGALFAQYSVRPLEPVRVSLGLRADGIRDRFRATEPEEGERIRASEGAVSPKAGINLRWLDTTRQTGHLFLTAGRSFKAPTLDQRFDQRAFPVPGAPERVSPANPDLVPQKGEHVEAGLYHTAGIPGGVRLDASFAAYRMDMEDELDFDLETLQYVNLGRSRHRGVEVGLDAAGPLESNGFVNFTLQHVISRGGPFDGNYLKAIPRRVVNAGASAAPVGELEVGFRVSHARTVYLDDANTIELDPFTRTDLRLSRPVAGMTVFLDVRNVLDSSFATTGYPDPAGGDSVFLFPAAGRTLELGIRSGG